MTEEDIYKRSIVFLAEDEKPLRDTASKILRLFFTNVYTFENGQEVIAKIESGIIPDIIVTDVNMPHVCGIKMMETIQSMGYQIPVIMVTAFNEKEHINRAMELNVKKFLIKPIMDLKEIVHSIKEVLTNCYSQNFLQKKINELQRWENQLSQYVLFIRTDTKGKIIELSNALQSLIEYDVNDIIGKNYSFLGSSPNPIYKGKNLLKEVKKNKKWQGEITGTSKKGSKYWLNVDISIEYNDDGKLAGYFAIANDITAKKDFESKHIQKLEEAKLHSMSELITNIAHQWRQPLSAITISATNALYKQEMDVLSEETIKESFTTINKYAQDMSQIIDTFAGFIKPTKEFIEVNIQERIEMVLSILEPEILKNDIELINLSTNMDSVILILLEGELAQVIMNIVKNGIDILSKKPIEESKWIKIDLYKEDKNIVISIEDNGGGINEKDLPHVFEAYYTTQHQSLGKGLGLHISHRIMTEKLNGNLRVENSAHGAHFFLELPLIN